MNRQDPLFLLVKSLDSGERAAVRLIDQKDSGYLALFDMLVRASEYDERKFKKRLAASGHKIHYAYAKNYLSRHILNVLAVDRFASAFEKTVAEIQILMDRKVFALAGKMLSKAMDLALASERWDSFLELSRMRCQLLVMEPGDLNRSIEEIQALNQHRVRVRGLMVQLGEYEDLFALYQPVVKRKQVARNSLDISLIQELKSHPLLCSSEPTSIRARRAKLQCEILVDVYLAHYESALEKLGKQIALYEEHEYLRLDHPSDYLNDLLRMGGLLLHFKRFADVEEILKRMSAGESVGLVHASERFDKYHRLLIALATETASPSLVLPVIDEIVQQLNTFRSSLPLANRMSFQVLLARFQLETGNYTEARLLLDEILREAEPGVREDIVSLSRVLLVLIYWEKGDLDLAESASKAARKFLQRKDQLFAFEKRMLKFFEAGHGFHHSGGELEKLNEDLDVIFSDPKEASVLGLFDLRAWLNRRKNIARG